MNEIALSVLQLYYAQVTNDLLQGFMLQYIVSFLHQLFANIFGFENFSIRDSNTPPVLVFVSNLYVYSFDGSLKILVVMCKCAFASLHDRICVNPLSPTPCNVNPQSTPQLAQSLPAPSSYLSQHHTPPSPLKSPLLLYPLSSSTSPSHS